MGHRRARPAALGTCSAQGSVGFTERHTDLLERRDLHMKRCQAAPEKCWIKDRNWPHQGTESLGEGWQGCQGRPMGKGNLSWTRKIQMG